MPWPDLTKLTSGLSFLLRLGKRTPDPIEARNIRKFGDRYGPTVDYMRSKGFTWQEITEASSRVNEWELAP